MAVSFSSTNTSRTKKNMSTGACGMERGREEHCSASQHIKWPNQSASAIISDHFHAKQGLSDVIGAIDGCHISIKKPRGEIVYCNRKGFTSIILQAVCDDKKQFLDVFCGEPGSMHDARVLRRSDLYAKASRDGLPAGRYLLGDSAYPNLPWLVTPFRGTGHLTAQQRQFNYKHSSSRIVIENTFGMLKGRFRRLKYFENINIGFIVTAVAAACVLHNICINFNDTDVTGETIEAGVGHDLPQVEDEVQEVLDRRQQIFNIVMNQ
ncbi:hypothetical protein MML48_1g00799 [Holotrichia oblita]|uniref:Uncharacterized protein n=1 Tax=Holotrichia oblita TaxID=644536 RepID=A0ACB9TYX4_HOLOL|nr:hypothetical protein MML48_1g00799 [Holotrichia oblita]